MIEPLEGMPDGTIGFRASGEVKLYDRAHVITIEDGKTRRTQEYFDRAEALAAAGLGPSSTR